VKRLWPLAASVMIAFPICAWPEANVSVPAGILMEHNFNNQWGLRAGFAHSRILKGHPRASLSWTSSRLSLAIGKNVLKKDNVLFGLGWHFLPKRLIDPYVRADAGFTRFDREDEEVFAKLDNVAPIVALALGAEGSIWKGIIRPWFDLGGSFLFSSTVYPFTFAFGLDFDIARYISDR